MHRRYVDLRLHVSVWLVIQLVEPGRPARLHLSAIVQAQCRQQCRMTMPQGDVKVETPQDFMGDLTCHAMMGISKTIQRCYQVLSCWLCSLGISLVNHVCMLTCARQCCPNCSCGMINNSDKGLMPSTVYCVRHRTSGWPTIASFLAQAVDRSLMGSVCL